MASRSSEVNFSKSKNYTLFYLLNSTATLKIDKTSLVRRRWPDFNAIWQADAE